MKKRVAVTTTIVAVNIILAATVCHNAWYMLIPVSGIWLLSVLYFRPSKKVKSMPKGFWGNLSRTKKLNK